MCRPLNKLFKRGARFQSPCGDMRYRIEVFIAQCLHCPQSRVVQTSRQGIHINAGIGRQRCGCFGNLIRISTDAFDTSSTMRDSIVDSEESGPGGAVRDSLISHIFHILSVILGKRRPAERF